MFSVILTVLIVLQSVLYLDIRADAFQFSYMEIQHNLGEYAYTETIPFSNLYFLNEDQKLERVGDHDELVLKPGEELQFYLSEEGKTAKLEANEIVYIQLQCKGYASLWLIIDMHKRKLDFIDGGEIFGVEKGVEGTVKLRNSSFDKCIIY